MQNYMEHYRAALTINERILAASLDYWASWAFPALRLAKYL